MGRKSGAVLKSLQNIESLFEFGGEITPFLEELFGFLNDLMPILAKANQALKSTTDSMPTAADNISSAEMMAESATHTIMDHADQISTDLEKLIKQESDQGTRASLEDLASKVAEINMALQFQDITSQHLRQATQIVEAIQSRMVRLFTALEEIGAQNELVKGLLDKYAKEAEEKEIETADLIRKDDAVSQDDIDAFFNK